MASLPFASQGDTVGSSLGSLLWLVAEADNGKGAAGPGQWFSLWPIAAILFLFYFLFIRPQRQEAGRRDAMIRALKPNDHVLTHGGIYGVVTNVHREANAVTIRVDENNNTRLKVSLGAIARVLTEEAAGETPAKKD
jgi:preprotein translocase subunit YajC